MKILKWLKSKQVKTVAAVTTAFMVTFTMAPVATAQAGGGVSGAFLGPISGTANGGNQSRGIFELVAFQSGDWKLDMNNPNAASPAWAEFSKQISVDRAEVQVGDVDGAFGYLQSGGLDRSACMKSSVIWVVRDTQYPGATANVHSKWALGREVTGDEGRIQALLTGARRIGNGTPNMLSISAQVAAHPAVQNQDFSDLKVLCSYQFAEAEPDPEPEPQYETCVGPDCDDTPRTPNNPTTQQLCQDTGWQSPSTVFDYAGLDDLADFVQRDGGNGISLGISGIGSVWTNNLISLQNGGQNTRDIRVAWRCNTRYMVYHQTAPASYATRTEMAPVVSPINNKVFSNSFESSKGLTGGLFDPIGNGNFESNSDIANGWFGVMNLMSPISAAPVESNLRITDFGKEWNAARNVDSEGSFDNFYATADTIQAAVERDEYNSNFSSGTDLNVGQQAVMANGGVLNVEEVERQKLIRVVQPYIELQIAKCVVEGSIIFPWDHCNPIPSGGARSYHNEKVNTRLTDPHSITLDQANYLINRAANLTRDISSGNSGSAALEGFTRLATIMNGNVGDKIEKCTVGANSRLDDAMYNGSQLDISNSGDLYYTISRIYSALQRINSSLGNISLPCQDVMELGNPEETNRILGAFANFTGEAAFFNSTRRNMFATNYIPEGAQVQVQKAQYNPETVSWWQAISVNCNQSGFEQLIAQTGADVLSDDMTADDGNGVSVPIIGSAFHGVARSPIVRVDHSRPETKFRAANFFFARPGTPSSMSNFYDKECPFNCVAFNEGFNVNGDNDAENNTPNEFKSGSHSGTLGHGAQIRDTGNENTYDDSSEELSHTDFINIFRDNEKTRVRVDTWYPTNNLGQLASQLEEIQNMNGDIQGFLNAAESVANTAELHASGGSSFGIIYDGAEPSTTTITRFEGGTPTIGDMFRVWAVTDRGNSDMDLIAGDGSSTEIFKPGTSTSIPTQRALSHDIIPNGVVGSETAAILPGLVNTIDVASKWASEKSRPQVFNFKWEYQVPSMFFGLSSVGFSRDDGTLDQSVQMTSQLSPVFTILEGKCYGMFGTSMGKNTIGLFGTNTGAGVPNNLDNNPTGLVTNSPSEDDEENLIINSLRATTE